jgi:hypothetical protein
MNVVSGHIMLDVITVSVEYSLLHINSKYWELEHVTPGRRTEVV